MSAREGDCPPAWRRPPRCVVAIAASAGGQEALTAVLAGLPADFPAVVLVMQHLAPGHVSYLARILGRACAMPVVDSQEGEDLADAVVYVAPPDRHMTIPDWRIHLDGDPRVNFVRPSADVLFRSVAATAGDGAIAVVLSGSGHDGAEGTLAIKHAGGRVVAQDEATAGHFGMPGAAIASTSVDAILPLESIATALLDYVLDCPPMAYR